MDRLLNLSYIHSSIDAIYDDRDLQGVEKTFGYFTLYGRYLKENHFVRMGTVLEKKQSTMTILMFVPLIRQTLKRK